MLKIIKESKKYRELCTVFMIKDATQKFIGGAGIELSPTLYNGKPCEKKKKKKKKF